MPFISITRLRIRSVRFLPFFAVHTLRALKQVKASPGFQGGSLLTDRSWTFWTMTAWDRAENMRFYMTNGSHRIAMHHLLDWCDEASVVHWEQPVEALPSWPDADRRMRRDGRPSKVHNPSPNHESLNYRAPRITTGGPILPER